MPEGLDLVFHSELTSTKQHPLLLNPPYQLTLSVPELTTPKDLNRNKNNEADDNIPRPHNAFILFRSDYAAKMKNNSNDQRISIRVISQMASKQWKKESEKVKLFFKVLADLYQEHHRELYPNYKYTPKSKSSPPYNVKKSKSKAISKRDELKRKKNECMITWYVHDNIEDEDNNTKDICNSTNFVVSNDPFEQDSQMSITRDSQQTPATFINYTASPSSSSLTFHSTTTTSTSTSSYDRFAVNNNYSSSGSSPSSSSPSPPPSPPQPENLLYWEPELPNNNNLLSLLDFDNEDFFFN